MKWFDTFMCWLLRVPPHGPSVSYGDVVNSAKLRDGQCPFLGNEGTGGVTAPIVPNGFGGGGNCALPHDHTGECLLEDNSKYPDGNTWSSIPLEANSIWASNASCSFVMPKPTNILTIYGPGSNGNFGSALVTIELDGKVTIHEGADVNEAAKVFWDAIYHHAPSCNCFLDLRSPANTVTSLNPVFDMKPENG